MTNRRQFLQSAAALSAVPLAGKAAFPHERVVKRDAASTLFVFDARHRAASSFAQHAAQLGARSASIEADITDLWARELRTRWTQREGVVVGLTERPALFLLERLAWDHGLRVVFQAEHEVNADATALHRLHRADDQELAKHLQDAGQAWPAALAEALLQGELVATRNYHPTESAMATHLGERSDKLYSWIIAPKNQSQNRV